MRKKLFAIVMSMTMVASFMPSLAFAAVTANHSYYCNPSEPDGDGKVTCDWAAVKTASETAASKDYVEVVKAPTHSETGVAKLTCQSDLCGEVIEVIINKIPHEYSNVKMTPAEFTAAKIAQGEKSARYAKTFAGNGYCKITAKKCSCGYVGSHSALSGNNVKNHDVPSTYKVCDKSYECTDCHVIVDVPDAHHDPADDDSVTVVSAAAACGNGAVIEHSKCEYCGQKYTEVVNNVKDNCTPKTTVTPTAKKTTDNTVKYFVGNTEIASITSTTSSVTVNSVANGYAVDATTYDDPVFYKWDVIVEKAADCTDADVVGFTCASCGKVINNAADDTKNKNYENTTATTASGHDWETKEVAADCTHPVREYKVCKNCGVYKNGNSVTENYGNTILSNKENSSALGHKIDVTKVDATCADSAYYVVKCSVCGKKANVVPNGTTVFDKNQDGVSMWINPMNFAVSYEKKAGYVELPFLSAKAATAAHKYTNKVVLREATCAESELTGYKCDECGKIALHGSYRPVETKAALAHDWKKVEIPATCGDYGNTVEQCSRCDLYKRAATETDPSITTDDVRDAISQINKDAKPLVAPGAKHSFDKWVVTKDSTVFEEGVKSLECSVCGADGNAKTVVAKKTVAKAAPTVKAGKKSLTVKATAANATGYRVYYKKAGAKSWKSYTKKTDSLSKTFSKLSKGKYYVKVKAYAKNYAGDGEVVWGATSSTKSVKVK